MFVPSKMASAGAESTWEKYDAFLNSFHPDGKELIRRLEWIIHKISGSKVSIFFNQTFLKRECCSHTHTHTHWDEPDTPDTAGEAKTSS